MDKMTARRKLGTRGRLVAVGLSVGAAGVLAGAMAITDASGDAAPATITNDVGLSSSSGTTATPYTPSSPNTPVQQTPTFPPHTRSGGS